MPPAGSLEEMIVRAIADTCYLQPHEVAPDLALAQLGLDSLGMTSVVAEIEALYARELNADQLITLFSADTVGDFIERMRHALEPSLACSVTA
jgi:acyl carrier protein